MSAKTMTMPRP